MRPSVSLSATIRAAALILGLASAAPAWAAPGTASAPLDEVDPEQPVAQAVIDLAGWVIASGDNRELPFAIVDKGAAQVLVFGADGKLRGMAPALIGSAVGDRSAEGVGDRELSDIPMEDRTTPAGRFLAAYGPAIGNKRVLWVDYATAVSIHPLAESDASERREARLASPTPTDNRITHGCINVSPNFYTRIVRSTFKKGGVFYVLPDEMPIRQAIPGFAPPRRFMSRRDTREARQATPVGAAASPASP